jgi:outer membrane protein TolC
MNARLLLFFVLLLAVTSAAAQEAKPVATRRVTLDQAVQLALQHNHVVRIAQYKVEEKEQAKRATRSGYFPLLHNDSSVLQLTDTQFIAIPQGSLGVVAGTPIPAASAILNQGERTLITSGTQLTQPLTELFKVRAANDAAAADLHATRSDAQQTKNEIALHVHQLYYRILIVQSQHEAAQAKLKTADDLNSERVVQVKMGSSLQEQALESRAQTLEASQDLLATELQLSDLNMQLNDLMGLPLPTPLTLEPGMQEAKEVCAQEECVKAAIETHPEVAKARAQVEEASSGVRLAKREYIPNVEAFARYSYQDNVPFLARNFGTFGVHFGYDLFDGGRRNAAIAERQAQLAQAKENLARVTEEVEVRVQAAHNKLERTQQMVKVSEELLALRVESHRVTMQQLQEGAALHSQADLAAAQELGAKTLLLQSQLDYLQAHDELVEAMGEMPDSH